MKPFQWERRHRFSIRKFSVGVASAVIGSSLFGVAVTVQADELPVVIQASQVLSEQEETSSTSTALAQGPDLPSADLWTAEVEADMIEAPAIAPEESLMANQTLAQYYLPQAKGLVIEADQAVVPSDLVLNRDQLPEDTRYEWIVAPHVAFPGQSQMARVRVTFSDESSVVLVARLQVRSHHSQDYVPVGRLTQVTVGQAIRPKQLIENANDLPPETNFTWSLRPSLSSPGRKLAQVLITYPDLSTELVSVPVLVQQDISPIAQPQLTVDQTVITLEEGQHQVDLTGRLVNGRAGDRVMIELGGVDHQAVLTGERFVAPLAGQDLLAHRRLTAKLFRDGRIVQQKEHSYQVLVPPVAEELTIDKLTSDNHINVTEAGQAHLTISGQARGAEMVEIIVGQKTEKAAVRDGRYRLDVLTNDLLTNSSHQVVVKLGRQTQVLDYTVAPWAVAQLELSGFETGQAGELVRISGQLAVEDTIYDKYRNLERIEELTLTLNKKTYSVGVHSGRFSFDISRTDLEQAKGQAFTISHKGRDNLYDLEVSGTTGTLKPVPALFNQLTLANVVFDPNAYFENGRVKSVLPAQVSRVSGQASGLAKPEDRVVIRLGDQNYEGKLDSTRRFAIDLPTDILNANRLLTAELQTHDAKGQEVIISLEQSYGPTRELDKTFRMTHDQSNPDRPYFVRALSDNDPKVQGYGHLQKDAFVYDKTRELTYSFNRYPGDLEIIDINRQVTRQVLDNLSHYANVTFRKVADDTLEEAVVKAMPENRDKSPEEMTWSDIQFYLTRRWGGNYAVYGGPVFYLPSQTDWDNPNFKRTFHHEIFHSLGAKHAHEGASNEVLPHEEDQNTMTVMTYRASRMNADINDIHLYDLIYLHFRYGVNPKTRAEDNVYSFKDFDIQKTDANIYVWDGGGIDTFDASQESQGVTVDLTPGSWIHRGDKTANFAIKSYTKYTLGNFFEGTDLTLRDRGRGFLTPDYETYNEFHNSQAFIGYGTQIERLIGSAHADTLTGNSVANDIYGGAGADTISGGAGDDYLDGGAGADQMDGGLGNDTFIVDHEGDRVTESSDPGRDHVISSVNFELPEHVEDLTLTGTAKTGQGNSLDNRITGNSRANTLQGRGGKDTFVFNSPLNGQIDTIEDFDGDDTIELSAKIFTAIDRTNPLGRIHHDSTSGYLAYLPNEAGQTDAIIFAKLPEGLVLRADLIVVNSLEPQEMTVWGLVWKISFCHFAFFLL